MNSALKDMLDAYQPKNPIEYQNAAREVVQEIVLLGLWRGGFFAHAAFYGGTALRIFHGLRRFSENEVRLDGYLPGIATELKSWGVHLRRREPLVRESNRHRVSIPEGQHSS